MFENVLNRERKWAGMASLDVQEVTQYLKSPKSLSLHWRLEQPLDDALRAIAESILIFERSWSVLAIIPWKFNDVYVFAYIGPVFASFLQVTGLICYAMLTRTCNYSDTILRQ